MEILLIFLNYLIIINDCTVKLNVSLLHTAIVCSAKHNKTEIKGLVLAILLHAHFLRNW